jgi:lipid-binding SYLF domain-containing protein
MRKICALTIAFSLACPAWASDKNREEKRLEACGQVFKEILNIPDGIPKELLNKAECVIVMPSVLRRLRPGRHYVSHW